MLTFFNKVTWTFILTDWKFCNDTFHYETLGKNSLTECLILIIKISVVVHNLLLV